MALSDEADTSLPEGVRDASTPVKNGLKKKSIPAGLWTKCPSCQHVMFNKALKENYSVCQKCAYHFIVGAQARISQLLDSKSFKEMFADLRTGDPLDFEGVKSYSAKLK